MISNSFSGVAHNGVETIDVFGKDVLIIGTVSITLSSDIHAKYCWCFDK